jgi:hypothetical protein
LLNREPGDSGDESLATTLADFNLTMMDRQIEELRDIELAFQRLKEGEYGVCVDCGQENQLPPLEGLPHCQALHPVPGKAREDVRPWWPTQDVSIQAGLFLKPV